MEGLTHTLLAATQVTTTTTPVVKDGNPAHSCSGTSAAGALQLATGASWNGTWFESQNEYAVETILGESHIFESGAPANYFWSFWLDDKEASVGACGAQLNPGDRVLFFPSCFGSACPPPIAPLEVEAPATVEAGTPFPLTLKIYDSAGNATPAGGASVTGGGASAVSDANGHATLTLTTPGESVLQISAPNAVRTEAAVCVHRRNDGHCGTTQAGPAPAAPNPQVSVLASQTRYTGPFAIVASATGLGEHATYKHGHAPRLLAGTVSAHTAVLGVSLSLRRSWRGRCYVYDGASERFTRARCGEDALFKVSSSSRFSYLLPFQLPRGRYVFDLEATDAWGNHTTLARGSSRTVFYVR
ncbi:MAG TPA: hypothetical protein VNZ05_07530 [Solirubrobacteraceae bacterium]|nr:hypothetical protein [Solirubrobacteraceae bacterium]